MVELFYLLKKSTSVTEMQAANAAVECPLLQQWNIYLSVSNLICLTNSFSSLCNWPCVIPSLLQNDRFQAKQNFSWSFIILIFGKYLFMIFLVGVQPRCPCLLYTSDAADE